jgi:hypothetical protein
LCRHFLLIVPALQSLPQQCLAAKSRDREGSRTAGMERSRWLSGCSSSFCSLTVGAPAKMAREVTEEQTQDIARGVRTYVERAAAHRKTLQIDS